MSEQTQQQAVTGFCMEQCKLAGSDAVKGSSDGDEFFDDLVGNAIEGLSSQDETLNQQREAVHEMAEVKAE